MDFDSTFVKLEALDNLAQVALKGKKDKIEILEELKAVTKLGMEGKITFSQSLSRRLKMFSATKADVDELTGILDNNITGSVEANKDFFRLNSNRIYIISGGFIDYIEPIVNKFGIRKDHILANKFIFDPVGNIKGIKRRNLLAQDQGKVRAVKSLDLKGETWVIGDGWTDYEIKQAGCAEMFVAFVENVCREVVVDKADLRVDNLDELLEAFNKRLHYQTK